MTKQIAEKKSKPRPKRTSPFKTGMEVFFTAFLKKDKQKFYLCRGILEKCPAERERQLFKVKIIAVATKPIGGPESFDQSCLINRVITKKFKELHKDVSFFMRPDAWIEVATEE